jgi:hypothetical protein
MERINSTKIPKLTIEEIAILPIETLLKCAYEAEEAFLIAQALKDRIDGALALKCSTNKNIMEA